MCWRCHDRDNKVTRLPTFTLRSVHAHMRKLKLCVNTVKLRGWQAFQFQRNHAWSRWYTFVILWKKNTTSENTAATNLLLRFAVFLYSTHYCDYLIILISYSRGRCSSSLCIYRIKGIIKSGGITDQLFTLFVSGRKLSNAKKNAKFNLHLV